MEIRTLRDLKFAYQNAHTNVGSYPLFLITSDGGTLCHNCVKSEYRSLVESLKSNSHDSWNPSAIDVNYESYLICDHCSSEIETAYGAINHPKYCDCEGSCDKCVTVDKGKFYCQLWECKLDTEEDRPLKTNECTY